MRSFIAAKQAENSLVYSFLYTTNKISDIMIGAFSGLWAAGLMLVGEIGVGKQQGMRPACWMLMILGR